MALNLAGGSGDPPPGLPNQHWISCALDLTRLPPVGSKVLYFPQGHFEQWAEHLAPPPAGHGPSFLCTVSSLEIVTGANAPYAVVSLTPVPQDDELAVAAAAPTETRYSTPRPTSFVYNLKMLSHTDVKKTGPYLKTNPWVGLPKSLSAVLPELVAGHSSQNLWMSDIKANRWHFTRAKASTGFVYQLRDGWRSFADAKNAGENDKLFILRGEDGRTIIEVRKAAGQGRAPTDLQLEVSEATKGSTFTATYYPHKGLGKFFVQEGEVQDAMGIAWEVGMSVRLRKDDLKHTTDPKQSIHPVTGVVKAVTDSAWHGLEINWADGSTSTASAWEVDVVADSPPRKKPKTTRLFGADLGSSSQNQLDTQSKEHPPLR